MIRLVLATSLLFGLLCFSAVQAEQLREVPITETRETLDVKIFPAQGETQQRLIWLTNQYGNFRGENTLAHALTRRGMEVWQVDILESLFLTREDDDIRGLDGANVAGLIQQAADEDDVVLAIGGVDRMAVPILRGVRLWQQQTDDINRLAGSVLMFPNLYRGTPVAGEDPEFLGIVHATNQPVMILQPQRGVYANRLYTLREALEAAGSPVFSQNLPDVADYFFVEIVEERPDSLEYIYEVTDSAADAEAFMQLPEQITQAVTLLQQTPRSETVLEIDPNLTTTIARQTGLVAVEPRKAPDFDLPGIDGVDYGLDDGFEGVRLVNFWATWCPACVEELPSMERLSQAFDDDLRMYGIAYQQSADHLRDFLEDYDVTFPIPVDDDGAVAKEYGAFAFPTSFLVDHNGMIRYSVNAGIIWDTPEIKQLVQDLVDEQFE